MIDIRDFPRQEACRDANALPRGLRIAFAGEARIWEALDTVTWSSSPWRPLQRRGAGCIPWVENRKIAQSSFASAVTRRRAQRKDAMLETLPIGAIAVPGSDLAHKACAKGVSVGWFGNGS
jgi:hypothetical protein